MDIAFPFGLLALIALPIVLILHLIRERRRRVVVPSLLIWRMLPRPNEAQRRRRLPLTLLLLLHLLVAACMGLALAQPQWDNRWFGTTQHVALVIDISTSMAAHDSGATTTGATRLEQAQRYAHELVASLGRQATVTLIAAGSQARVVASGLAYGIPIQTALDTLQAGGTGSDLLGGVTLAQASLAGYRHARVVVYTDGAQAGLTSTFNQRILTFPVEWQHIGTPLDNRAIVVFAATAGRTGVPVYARIANYSAKPQSSRLRLFGDDQLLDERRLNLRANGEAEVTWTVPQSITLLRAELEGRDGLAADDQATLSLAPARMIVTRLVTAAPSTLERALRALPNMQINSMSLSTYALDTTVADITVFDSILPPTWPAGAVLVINPPVGDQIPDQFPLHIQAPLADTLTTPSTAQTLSASDALFKGLNLESIRFGPVRRVAVPPWATTQLARGDIPLILRGRAGASEVAIWSFDVAKTNLSTRLAFPLLVARTIQDLLPTPLPAAVLAGDTVQIQPSGQVTAIEVLSPDGTHHTVARDKPESAAQFALDLPGLYTVVERDAQGVVFKRTIAANAGSARESDLRLRELLPELQISGVSAANAETDIFGQRDRIPVWPILALLTIAVLIVEWVYAQRS